MHKRKKLSSIKAACYSRFRQREDTTGTIIMQRNDQVFKATVLQRFLSTSQV
ncbi:hypothetical protein SynSYN20_01136 [Synechococcus sp. SYN20]|nr:hypothetical protein SynSYN20_01136 [Synechococcus sp. SYN20]